MKTRWFSKSEIIAVLIVFQDYLLFPAQISGSTSAFLMPEMLVRKLLPRRGCSAKRAHTNDLSTIINRICLTY